MKLIDMMKAVSKDIGNVHELCWCEDMYQSVDLDYYMIEKSSDYSQLFSKRLVSYWLTRWMCTDTMVGLRVIYFDGEPAGLYYQAARKSTVEISYLNKDVANEIRQFLLSLYQVPQPNFDIIKIDQQYDQGEYYCLTYASQVVDKQAILLASNEFVEVTKTRVFDEDGDYRMRQVEVTMKDGTTQLVIVGDLGFKYRIEDKA